MDGHAVTNYEASMMAAIRHEVGLFHVSSCLIPKYRYIHPDRLLWVNVVRAASGYGKTGSSSHLERTVRCGVSRFEVLVFIYQLRSAFNS